MPNTPEQNFDKENVVSQDQESVNNIEFTRTSGSRHDLEITKALDRIMPYINSKPGKGLDPTFAEEFGSIIGELESISQRLENMTNRIPK